MVSLGLVAGGIAKGYAQGEDLKNERARRDALEEETRAKREERRRKDDARAALGGIPIPGQTEVPSRYDPTSEIDARIAAAQPAPHQRSGLLGALGKFLDKDAAAIGSGVKPPAAMPAAAPQKGALPTPGQTAPPAAAASAAAPQPGTVEEVTVQSGPTRRVATEEDAALYRWMTARKTGDIEGERTAGKEYFDLKIGNAKKALMFADDDELSMEMSDITGSNVTVERDAKGGYTVKADDQVVGKYGSRQEMLGEAFARLDRSPEAGLQLAMQARQEQRQSQLARSQTAALAEQIRASRVRSGVALAENDRAQRKSDQEIADAASADRALALLSNPANAMLYPDEWEAASTALVKYMPQSAISQMTSPDGTRSPVNTFSIAGKQHREAYETNPYVVGKVIAIAPDQNGVPRFWVKGKGTERIAADTLSQAERIARSIYKTPPGTK